MAHRRQQKANVEFRISNFEFRISNEERRAVAFSILHSKFFIRNSSVKKKARCFQRAHYEKLTKI